MKTILCIALALMVQNSFANIVKSLDQKNGCDLYRATKTEEAGEISRDEVIVIRKPVYGIKIENMEIDFQNEEVRVTPIAQTVLGFDRPLVERAVISSSNKDFKVLVNQLNRTVTVFDKICISSDNKIIYGHIRESQKK